jgi:ABC-type Zn uptake system ZnuABC Zn-binding protein ZnuA
VRDADRLPPPRPAPGEGRSWWRRVIVSPIVRGLAILVVVVLASGCAGPGGPSTAPGDQPLVVVATTGVFADLVRQVGGEAVSVTSLVPNGGDVETYDPRPADVAAIAAARLVVMNGLGLDDWLDALLRNAGGNATVLRLAEGLTGVTYLRGENGTPNPHLWLDVRNAIRYVERIRDALIAADPTRAVVYREGADRYLSRLSELDGWIRASMAAVPASARRIVAFHDAFPYYAAAYGITVVGVIVPTPGQEPSAAQLAALVEAIRSQGVRVVVAEAQYRDQLARTLAAETGVTVTSDLYTDTPGPPPADTYEGLMRWDTERLVAAMEGRR